MELPDRVANDGGVGGGGGGATILLSYSYPTK
jgi:hypothetical protein